MNIETILNEVTAAFNMGIVKETSPATNGLGNGNHFVTTDKGEFVLRILVAQTLEGLENEVSIQEQLQAVGIPTPELLRAPNGDYYLEIQNQYVTCSKRIKGIHPELATEEISKELGVTLAKFHQTVTQLPRAGNSWLRAEAAKREIIGLPQDSLASEIRDQLESSFDLLTSNLPRGFIHGDLHFGNLLLTPENQIAVFDFEEAGENILILDIAMSALSLYDHSETGGKELLRSLINGYESVRQLTLSEKENLAKAVLYASGVAASWLYNQKHIRYATEAIHTARRISNFT